MYTVLSILRDRQSRLWFEMSLRARPAQGLWGSGKGQRKGEMGQREGKKQAELARGVEAGSSLWSRS